MFLNKFNCFLGEEAKTEIFIKYFLWVLVRPFAASILLRILRRSPGEQPLRPFAASILLRILSRRFCSGAGLERVIAEPAPRLPGHPMVDSMVPGRLLWRLRRARDRRRKSKLFVNLPFVTCELLVNVPFVKDHRPAPLFGKSPTKKQL